MSLDPHDRPLLQSEDDVSESLQQLQLDEPSGDGRNASTATISTPSSAPPSVSIPEDAFEELCESLEDHIQSSHPDGRIQRHLDNVWFAVNKALKNNKSLETRLANQEEFRANLKKSGEQQFIDLLRNMAKRKNWRDLLHNSTSFPSSDIKYSNGALSLGLFYKEILPDTEEPAQSPWTEASMNGTQQS
jgi:hypothetical protein